MDQMLVEIINWMCIMSPLLFLILGIRIYRAYEIHKFRKRFR